MRKLELILFVTAVLLMAAGYAASEATEGGIVLAEGLTSVTATTSGQDACPVTLAPDPGFVPPEPWPAGAPYDNDFWYGTAGLWTALPADGEWAQLAKREKFWLWSEEFDVAEDETPDVVMSARRLDGEAADFQQEGATNGYHPDFDWAMLTGVDLPTTGCWEFNVEYAGHQLTFVTWVPEN